MFSGWLLRLIYIESYMLQFEDACDAEDAIRYRDGYNFDGFLITSLYIFSFFPFILWFMKD